MADSTTTSTPTAATKLSPAMEQYAAFKRQYPQYVLFFRMGDFYEMFWEDAQLAARTLGVALTSRSRGGLGAEDAIPMAGVPFHAVEGYLRRMIAAGHKVAICEQVQDPAAAKGIIQRDVVRLVTPGTLTDDPLLDSGSSNFLAAVASGLTKANGYRIGVVWVELSTGACVAASGSEREMLEELARIRPAEILLPEMPSGQLPDIAARLRELGLVALTARPSWHFTLHHAKEQLQAQWQVATAGGFGFDDDDPAVLAVAGALTYLHETQKTNLAHLPLPHRHRVEKHLSIDPASWRSLEIDRTLRAGGTEGSLLAAIRRTQSSMGSRLLMQWLRTPLCDVAEIGVRQSAVAALLDQPAALASIGEQLQSLCDIERIVARIAVGRVAPRDLAGLAECLRALPKLFDAAAALAEPEQLLPGLPLSREFALAEGKYLASAIAADPAPHLREGGVIAGKFDPELDRLRDFAKNSQKWLAEYQGKLIAETGIPSLRVGFNKVFGYYIEVTETHRDKAPAAWTRKQTVKNAERYVTEELKKFEDEALGAQEKAIKLEQALFEQVRQALLPKLGEFQRLAADLARLDVLVSFALLARERRYARPTITEDRILEIVDGKHPVLEQQLGSEFVSNDTHFGPDDTLNLITGPNMAGKSTYIRQIALITLLAQVGSYVPARSATVGLTDRLFTRIGASDELHAGQSTFMVEMVETANILNSATPRSLVILDEIGRGTSTLDGLSLAWAIAEHLASHVRCRALFATHYHELTDLAARFPGIRNFNVAVREWEDQVVFLHRIVEGGADRSYGIHVARLAGVPRSVLDRARQLLSELTVQQISDRRSGRHPGAKDASQLQLFADPAKELADRLAKLNLDRVTADRALEILQEWKKTLGL
jgi:DNA mismatch repair protein MutS